MRLKRSLGKPSLAVWIWLVATASASVCYSAKAEVAIRSNDARFRPGADILTRGHCNTE